MSAVGGKADVTYCGAHELDQSGRAQLQAPSRLRQTGEKYRPACYSAEEPISFPRTAGISSGLFG